MIDMPTKRPPPPTEKEMHDLFLEGWGRGNDLGLRRPSGKFRYLYIECPDSEGCGHYICWRDLR